MPISIPKFFQKAFAASGGKTDVPITGADINNGRADYENGFPPITRSPIAAGGVPPYGTDFNGVLYDLSQAIQYLQSGVSFPFDQDFADAIGGYSVKAIVADPSDPTILWQNNNANNTLPPSAPNGWTQVFSASELNQNPTESQRGAPFLATQAQAEAGTNNTAMMTALRVFQLIRSSISKASEALYGTIKIGTQSEVNAGISDEVAVTPLKLLNWMKSQSYVNVTSSRIANTTYTNTTGKTISVGFAGYCSGSSDTDGWIVVGGVNVLPIIGVASQARRTVVSFQVPSGSTYSFSTSSTLTIIHCSELR